MFIFRHVPKDIIPGKFLWDEYIWNGDYFDQMHYEIDDVDDVIAACPGVASAANSYMSLVNVDDHYTEIDRGVPPNSPGLGAITVYHGRSWFADVPLQPGQEIFVS
jgi:hypothetical protein